MERKGGRRGRNLRTEAWAWTVEKHTLMVRVSDQEDALDSGEACAGEAGQGSYGGGGALGVAFEDEAFLGGGGEGGGDVVDDLGGGVVLVEVDGRVRLKEVW